MIPGTPVGKSNEPAHETQSFVRTFSRGMLKLAGNLTFQVGLALVTAVLLGYFFPAKAIKMEKLGVWFIDLVKISPSSFFLPSSRESVV